MMNASSVRLGFSRSSRAPDSHGLAAHRHLAPIATVSIAATLAATFVFPTLHDRPVEEGDILLGVLTLTTIFPLLYSVWSPVGDVFSPVPLLGALILIQYVVRAMYLRDGPDGRIPAPVNLRDDYQVWITPALELVTSCWLCMLVCIYSPIPRVLVRLLPRFPSLKLEVSPERLTIIIGLSLASIFYMLVSNQLSAFRTNVSNVDLQTRNFLVIGSTLLGTSLFIMASKAFRGGPGARVAGGVTIAILLLQVGLGVYQGGKGATFWPLINIAAAYHYFRNRVGIRELGILAAILVFVVLPVISTYRQVFAEDTRSVGVSLEQSAGYAAKAARTVSANDSFVEDALGGAAGRLAELDCPMVAMKMTPRFIPWADTNLYALFPILAIVPRAMWPDKPLMTILPNWERDYWGDHSGGSSYTRSMIGALYCAFGIWGTILFMGLHAIGLQTLYLFVRENWGAGGAALHSSLLVSMAGIGSDFPTAWAHIIQVLIVMLPILWFVSARPSRARARAWA
jgi:hypothetical protein